MTRFAAAAAALLLTLTLAACGDDDSTETAADAAPGHTMPDGSTMAGMDMSQVGDGTQATVNGYTIAAVKAPQKVGRAGKLTFTIKGPNGVQKDYTRKQDKLMHAYVVREDLTQYQHIHPSIDQSTGVWSADLTIPEPGPYRVVTEFEALTPDRDFADRILGAGFTVAGNYQPSTATPAALGSGSVGDYDVTLEGDPKVGGGDLKLRITSGGVDVTDLQPYLASFAHITGFRENDLNAVHAHPSEAPDPDDASATGGPEFTVSPMFQEPGRYRMFVQFQTGGTVHLVPIDIEVT